MRKKREEIPETFLERKRNPRGNVGFKLIPLKPKTKNQGEFIKSFNHGKNIIAVGSAGTGKTFLSCYLALKELFSKNIEKIFIIRSAVCTRNQGFLPGSLKEKEEIYSLPFKNIINTLCDCGTAWDTLERKGFIEFLTTSYIRGITLDNCIVIVDEIQNVDPQECESLLTRIGENCKLFLCGDTRQNDLFRKKEVSCFNWLLNIGNKLPEYFQTINFTSEDIVRSEFCKAIILAIENT